MSMHGVSRNIPRYLTQDVLSVLHFSVIHFLGTYESLLWLHHREVLIIT